MSAKFRHINLKYDSGVVIKSSCNAKVKGIIVDIEELTDKEELPSHLDVYVAPISDDVRTKAYEITQELRKNGIKVDVDLNGKKFKKLMNYADKIKVPKMVIIGAKDLEEGKVTIKDMVSGSQELVDIDNIAEYIKGE